MAEYTLRVLLHCSGNDFVHAFAIILQRCVISAIAGAVRNYMVDRNVSALWDLDTVRDFGNVHTVRSLGYYSSIGAKLLLTWTGDIRFHILPYKVRCAREILAFGHIGNVA